MAGKRQDQDRIITEKKRQRRNRPRSRRLSYMTETQKAIYDFIADYQNQYGISPTQREIRDHFGYASFGTVYKHLELLQKKGYLYRDWNQKRGLELVRAAPGEQAETEIPFLGLIAAGQPIESLPVPEKVAVPNHLLGGQPDEHYVLRVIGDSMIQEGIYDGDYVVVLRRDRASAGEMVVALVGKAEVTLKRFYPEGDMVRLQPANPSMEPIRVPAGEIGIQGVVVGLMRQY